MPKIIPHEQRHAIVDAICERLALGESLSKICRDDDMPDRNTVADWCASDEVLAAKCARARDAQAEYLADETLAIADSAVDAESAQCAKVRISARQWYAAKVAPKKYGDKLETENKHTGNLTIAWANATDADTADK